MERNIYVNCYYVHEVWGCLAHDGVGKAVHCRLLQENQGDRRPKQRMVVREQFPNHHNLAGVCVWCVVMTVYVCVCWCQLMKLEGVLGWEHRVDTECQDYLQSSELAPPAPYPQASVATPPPTPWFQGRGHTC